MTGSVISTVVARTQSAIACFYSLPVFQALHKFAKVKCILPSILIEGVIGIILIWLFWTHSIVRNGWGSGSKIYVNLLLFGMVCRAIGGAYAVCHRRVRTTRLYANTTAYKYIVVWLSFYSCWKTSCNCRDYVQCKTIVSFSGSSFVNIWPKPIDAKIKSHPPYLDNSTKPWWEPTLYADTTEAFGSPTIRNREAWRDSSSTSAETLGATFILAKVVSALALLKSEFTFRCSHRLESLRNYVNGWSSRLLDAYWNLIDEDAENQAEQDELINLEDDIEGGFPTEEAQAYEHRLQSLTRHVDGTRLGAVNVSALYKARGLPKACEGEDDQGPHGPSFECKQALVLALEEASCTCGGNVFLDYRQSCFTDPGQSNYGDGRYGKDWCWLRRVSGNKVCEPLFRPEWKTFTGHRKETSSDEKWTYNVCEKARCSCSRVPMSRPDARKLADPSDTSPYGVECRRWRVNDTRPWCFVGFDTTCAERRWTYRMPRFAMQNLYEVSQWKSSNPCQEHEYDAAVGSCQVWIDSFALLTFLMLLLQVPQSVLCYVFLQNHCGDHVEMDDQFDIESWSDSSESAGSAEVQSQTSGESANKLDTEKKKHHHRRRASSAGAVELPPRS